MRQQLTEQQQQESYMWRDSGGGDFEQPPVGTHPARCVRIIDIGTQKGEYQGKATFKRQVVIAWELSNELMTEGDYAGKPFMVSRFYTASLGEKANLRKDLVSWRGKEFSDQELTGFDPRNILDKGCMVSLIENDKGKIRVSSVMALPKGLKLADRINDLLYFSLERGEFESKIYEGLSDGYKKMIGVSPEYQELMNPSNASMKRGPDIEDLDDSIPF